MRKGTRIWMILFFVALTFVLTVIVVYTWEQLLMRPLYLYVRKLFPEPQYTEDYQWRLAQRFEHFWISIVVDLVVVSILLWIVDRQQHRLSLSEERYRTLFAQAGDGIGVISAADHRLIDVNKRFAEILGYSPEVLHGRHFCEQIESDSEGNDSASDLCKFMESDDKDHSGNQWSNDREIILKAAAGRRLPAAISCNAIATGKEKLFIVIIRDLTARKRLEREKSEMQRQLYQSAKLASIGELSAGVAHEINNPLNCIINFAQLLKDEKTERTETEQRIVDGIIDEGERIAGIVRDLLTFARQDPQTYTQADVSEVIGNSVSLFGYQLAKDGIQIEVDVPEDIWPAMVDASRLRQVVINMISNARLALKDKEADSKVFRISARNIDRGDGPMVQIDFFDNGVGIAREHIEKVFDPFFTTRRDSGGTGLGLSVSFGIIRDYKGTIRIESGEGAYARFIVELPAANITEKEYAQSAPRR
jgi:PAS domain S-box-containing protein